MGNLWKRVAGFEVYHNGIGGGRYIDIVLKEENLTVRMEVKSWKKMYPLTFIKQFVEKDLANVTSLDELRWVFDAKYEGDLKADILKALKSKKGKAALNKLLENEESSSNIKKWFNVSRFDNKITDSNIETFVNEKYQSLISTY